MLFLGSGSIDEQVMRATRIYGLKTVIIIIIIMVYVIIFMVNIITFFNGT